MSKQKQEAKVPSPAPDRPVCPYCGTVCRHNGTTLGVRYYICDVKIGGCGKFTVKIGKPIAPAYDNQGFSARP
jgi:hypothetical protein